MTNGEACVRPSHGCQSNDLGEQVSDDEDSDGSVGSEESVACQRTEKDGTRIVLLISWICTSIWC